MCKVFDLFMLCWFLVGNICKLAVRKYSILQCRAVERNIAMFAGVEVPSVYEMLFAYIILCHVLLCKGIFSTLFLSLKPGQLNCIRSCCIYCNKKKSNPITGLDRPWGFQEAEAPKLQDSRHMKVIRLSALRTGSLYPRKYSWNSFLLESESNLGP